MPTSTLSKEASFDNLLDGTTLAHAIVGTVRDPLLVLSQNLHIVTASRSFYQTFQLARENVVGHLLYEMDGGQWNFPELRAILEEIAKDHAPIEAYEVDRVFPVIGRRTMLLNARKVCYGTGVHTAVLLAFEDITARREVERQVHDLLREKDMLPGEMQHRVANSLQIIASILLMKARTVQSEETRLQLRDAHQRVLSAAAVQQHLHANGPNGPIMMADCLSKLCKALADTMIGDSRPISLEAIADDGTIPPREAVSVGLLVTELVMNALKHAFRGERPDAAIVVSYSVAETDWKLTISDNGIGKADAGAARSKPGLGTSLIHALARQLDARVETVSGTIGTAVSVTHATFKSGTLAIEEKSKPSLGVRNWRGLIPREEFR